MAPPAVRSVRAPGSGTAVGIELVASMKEMLAPVRPLALRVSPRRMPGELRTRTSPTEPGRPMRATPSPGQSSMMILSMDPMLSVLSWTLLRVVCGW